MSATFQCNQCKQDLPIEQKFHGRMCRECKKAKSRKQTANKKEGRENARKARFVTAEDWWSFNVNNKQHNLRYVPPKRDEFASMSVSMQLQNLLI